MFESIEKVLTVGNASGIMGVRNYKNKNEKEQMKSLKEHKVQILAAIALAFSLGMVVPSAVFASEGGVAVQAEGATASVSVQQLLDVIHQAPTVTNYAAYKSLVNAYNGVAAANPADGAVATAVQAVKALVTDAPISNDSSVATVKTYIEGMSQYKTWSPAINAINAIMKKADVTSETAVTATALAGYSPEEIAQYYNAINNVVNPMPATYAENVVVLAGRINTGAGFANYRTYEPLVAAVVAYEAKPSDAALKAELAKQVGDILNIAGSTNMSTEALLVEAKGIEGYDKYVALYNSMAFIREALPAGTTVITADLLNAKYPAAEGKNELADYYGAMAVAAAAIDASSVNNLLPFTMPDTSVGGDPKPEEKPSDVNTPNTGIVGLIESGALDLGMVTLIASVAVASVAGLGLIAKLYLGKKF